DPSSPDNADPINGREWDTAGVDMQYACTFPLPTPKDCTTKANLPACDCFSGKKPPICDPTTATLQIRGKAYPGVRQLEVARALADGAIVSSICPLHAVETSPADPAFGYRAAITALGNRMARSLVLAQ